jgi:glycogen(starch) synthase
MTPSDNLCLFTRMWQGNGTGLFAQGLASGLLATGARLIYICPRTTSGSFETPQDGLLRLRPTRENSQGPRLYRIARSLARMGGGALALARARLSCRDFILTIPDPLVFTAVEMALLRLSGARIVFVAHDVLPHAWKLPSQWRAWEIATYKACYRLASAVVVLSAPTRQHFARTFPDVATPVHVVEHGPLNVGPATPLPGNSTLLCFGTIRHNKGVAEAIAGVAAARAAGRDVRLIVAGEAHPQEPAYAQHCQQLAEQAGDAVEFRLGYVEDDAVAALLAQCDALLMPYADFHSQSGVALLAATNARPIIATAAGGIGALLDEGMPAVRIAQPAGAHDVAQAIGQFFDCPLAQWQASALAYREHTLAARSWQVCARGYRAVLKGLR